MADGETATADEATTSADTDITRPAPQMPDREALYTDLGDGRWFAGPHTAGPWDPQAQHGGPPSALLARAIENIAPRPEMMISRVTVELLGPVPVGELSVRAAVTRPGRNVELLEAAISAGGRDAARATAWRVTRATGAHVPPRHAAPPPFPENVTPPPPGPGRFPGFPNAIEWRATGRGRMSVPGPAALWGKVLHPLVADEEMSPLQRLMALADNANGISSEIDFRTHYFINPELTVHIHREPAGEWICLDAATTITDGGVGLATSVLSDLSGPVAVGAQSLLVAERPRR